MPSKDRQRVLARAKLERQMARRAAAARQRRRLQAAIGALVAVVAIVAGTVFLIVKFGPEEKPATEASAASDPRCVYTKPPAERADPATTKNVGTPPTGDVPDSGTRTATLRTNVGVIEIELDQAAAPCTVNSFSYLAGRKYYDNAPCHRLVVSGLFVLQCGDPFGKGSGGPGYQFADENLPKDLHPPYPAGTVAMANGGPGTNGSQFFIVYKDTELPADYSVFGRVTKGLDTVVTVSKAGVVPANPQNPADGAPRKKTTLQSVTVSSAAPTS